MKEIDERVIADIVRAVLAEQLNKEGKGQIIKNKDVSGVLAVRGSSVMCEKFDTGKPGDQVYLKDVLTLDENSRLACGFMEMKQSEFDWTLNYDEVDYIIEGILDIKIGDRKVSGGAGDVIMIPRGTSIKFSCPDYVKFFYVTYPANWSELV